MPYGWQAKDEQVAINACSGKQLNCLGLLSVDNQFIYQTTTQTITAEYMVTFLDTFSWTIQKPTVLVFDNAPIHQARKIKERLPYWQDRGLYIFYLPPYSPHLNRIERVWKELKARYLKPDDYLTFDTLRYATVQALNNLGIQWKINFSKYC